jgi:hypothetical protein
MGNYRNLEIEFIERTLHLISQYEDGMFKHKFEERYNHTLLINCLLGLIVMPKEKVISYLPNERLNDEFRKQMGIQYSTWHDTITDLRGLIEKLRNTVAHFDIKFESDDDAEFLIDHIVFKDTEKGENYVVASFVPQELLNFTRYYGNWLIDNIRKHRP